MVFIHRILFLVIIIFSLSLVFTKSSYAQVCTGTVTCTVPSVVCQDTFTLQTCAQFSSPTCVCTTTYADYTYPCQGSDQIACYLNWPPQCTVAIGPVTDTCAWGAAATPTPSNPCAPDTLGPVCGIGNCCGSQVCTNTNQCCPAGSPYVCNGGCSSSPCAAPSPTPSTVCPPNSYQGGTYCDVGGGCHDNYCNATGTGIVPVNYPAGSGACAACAPTPTTGSGVTPVVTQPPVGNCGVGQFACGSTCCNTGLTCVSPEVGGSCVSAPPSGGGGCFPSPYFNGGHAILDNNKNFQVDMNLLNPSNSIDAYAPNSGNAVFTYNLLVNGTPAGTGTYPSTVDDTGYMSYPIQQFNSFNGTLIPIPPYAPAQPFMMSFTPGSLFAEGVWTHTTVGNSTFCYDQQYFYPGPGPWNFTNALPNSTDVLLSNTPVPGTVTANVFVDTNGNKIKDPYTYCIDSNHNKVCDANESDVTDYRNQCNYDVCVWTYVNSIPTCTYVPICAVKVKGEDPYKLGATVSLTGLGFGTTDANGQYKFPLVPAQTPRSLSLTPPTGFQVTTTNPYPVNLTSSQDLVVDFGINQVSSCFGGLTAINNGDGTYTLSVTSCSNVPLPPPTPFTWTPDVPPGGNPPGVNLPPPTISGQTDSPVNAPTSSTVRWTPPACQVASKTYNPQVIVSGGGAYTTSITVPATFSVTTVIKSVADVSVCNPSVGTGLSGTKVNVINGSSYNQSLTTDATGLLTFTCVPSGGYQVTAIPPSGYTVVGTNGGTSTSGNTINISPLSGNTTVTFCLAPLNSWFQTDIGDVRFYSLTNPVPAGKYGSLDPTYPGIFFSSSTSNAAFGSGSPSQKGWYVNGEYTFNADTANKNGGMSYDFYKSKILKDGVQCDRDNKQAPCVVHGGAGASLDWSEIPGSGVYEVTGDITIDSALPARLWSTKSRVVLLVSGDATISTPIVIPKSQGLFIVAAKGSITIAKTVGTSTVASTTTNLDGYYSAEKDITIDGDRCANGTTSDLRLNVGGALIANSLKPLAANIAGYKVNNKRSLCNDNLTYPSLYIVSRPDFLTQLTDFYKTSYTKWQEVNP